MAKITLEDLFDLKDTTYHLQLEDDFQSEMNKYVIETENHENKKRDFINMFKECYDELCIFMEQDPKRRVAISCFTCIKGMDLRDKYGSPKKKS